jgi:hypothetical protein
MARLRRLSSIRSHRGTFLTQQRRAEQLNVGGEAQSWPQSNSQSRPSAKKVDRYEEKAETATEEAEEAHEEGRDAIKDAKRPGAGTEEMKAVREAYNEALEASRNAEKASKKAEKVGADEAAEEADDAADDAARVAKEAAAIIKKNMKSYFRPVSVAVFCVMVLTIECLLMYTALVVVRNYEELSGSVSNSVFVETLAVAARCAAHPPMLCMVFVSCRMYILATTEGLGEPPDWVKACMLASTVGVSVQFLIVLLLPFIIEQRPGEGLKLSELAGEPQDAHPLLHALRYRCLCLRFVVYSLQVGSAVSIYLGGGLVIVGTLTFPADAMKMSPANTCTMVLGAVYLSVNLVHWLTRVFAEQTAPMGGRTQMTKAASLMASRTLRKAPMFAILFLASFMRALWIDPPYGRPQRWAQLSFYAGTAALLGEAVVAAVIGATGKLEEEKSIYGKYFYASSLRLHIVEKVLGFLGYLSMLLVIVAMLVITDPDDGKVRPLNPAVKATAFLAALYFAVSGLQWVVSLSEDVMGRPMPKAHATMVAAEASVSMCPLVSVLFICCRMRALQITNYLGAPQHWAQNCMYMCTFAIFMQSLCCIFLPFFTGKATLMDEDGNATHDLRPMLGAYMVAVVKYISLFCLHGGVLTICAAIYMMTPTSARGDHDAREDAVELMVFLAWLIAVVVIALLLSSAKVAGLAIKLGIESTGKVLLGAEITIARVALSVCTGNISLGNLVVRNPDACEGQDWDSPYLLKVESLDVNLNIWRLLRSFGNEFALKKLALKGVDVCYDLPGLTKHSNVHTVMDKLKQAVEDAKSIKNRLLNQPLGVVQGHVGAVQDHVGAVQDQVEGVSKAVTSEVAAASGYEHRPKSEKEEEDDGKGKNKTKKKRLQVLLHHVLINDLQAHAYVSKMLLRFDLADVEFEDFQKQFADSRNQTVEVVVKAVLTTILKTVLSNQKLLAQSAARAASAAAAKAASQAAMQLGLGSKTLDFTVNEEGQ